MILLHFLDPPTLPLAFPCLALSQIQTSVQLRLLLNGALCRERWRPSRRCLNDSRTTDLDQNRLRFPFPLKRNVLWIVTTTICMDSAAPISINTQVGEISARFLPLLYASRPSVLSFCSGLIKGTRPVSQGQQTRVLLVASRCVDIYPACGHATRGAPSNSMCKSLTITAA